MTGLLASVRNLAEARQALAANADIIDLKEPAAGSLGALDMAVIRQVVRAVAGRCPVSATIGDLPMQPDLIYGKTLATAKTGVDYVKIGLFQDPNTDQVISKLGVISTDYKLIAVLFADKPMNSRCIAQLKKAGFTGVMLDTFAKDRGSLTGVMPLTEISAFVDSVKKQDMLCGLAGSLSVSDISVLLPLQPDYLGFRGALCDGRQRIKGLNKEAIHQIQLLMTGLPC
jgi:uncharacterized protein (UPF0264 family)